MSEPEFTPEELAKMVINEANWARGNPAALSPTVYRNLIRMRKEGKL